MNPYTLKTTVDVSDRSKEIVWESLANIGDKNAHKIIVGVVDGKTAVNLSAYKAMLQVLRNDGATRYIDASVDENGCAVATLDASCYEVIGRLVCTMVITDTKTDMVFSAARVFLEVTEKNGSAVVDPSHVTPSYADLLNEIENMRQGTAAANSAAKRAEDGESVREIAESKRVEAENSRDAAEKNREKAETARVEAEKKRVTAENGRVDAEKSRTTAEESREKQAKENKSIVNKFSNVDLVYETLPPSEDGYGRIEQTENKTTIFLGVPTSNLAYATFWIDFEKRMLMMRTPNGFSAINFSIKNRQLTVTING